MNFVLDFRLSFPHEVENDFTFTFPHEVEMNFVLEFQN